MPFYQGSVLPHPTIEVAARSPSRTLTLVAASLGFVVVQLDVTIVNVALQQLGRAFASSVSELQWVVDAYTIAFASLIPTAGALGDRIGAKRVFIAGMLVFTLASLGCAAASDMVALVVARIVQGIGAASLVPCSLALVNHAYRDEAARAKAVAVWAAGASVALAAGPVIGGLLVTSVGWRSIFLINVPLGAVGIWLMIRFAAETPRSGRRGLDVAGQCAIVIAVGAAAAAAIEAGRLGPGHPLVIIALSVLVVAAVSFGVIEARGNTPMLPLTFFRSGNFSAAIIVGLLINIAYYGLIFLFSLLFQRAKGYTPLETGLAFVPMTAGVLAANLAAGRLTAQRGARLPMIGGQIMFLAGCLFLLAVTPATPFGEMWWQLLLMGGGIGLVVPAMTTAVLGSVAREQSGIASGALNATRQIGSVIGVALYGSLISGPGAFAHGTLLALSISTGLLAAGAALCVRHVRP